MRRDWRKAVFATWYSPGLRGKDQGPGREAGGSSAASGPACPIRARCLSEAGTYWRTWSVGSAKVQGEGQPRSWGPCHLSLASHIRQADPPPHTPKGLPAARELVKCSFSACVSEGRLRPRKGLDTWGGSPDSPTAQCCLPSLLLPGDGQTGLLESSGNLGAP